MLRNKFILLEGDVILINQQTFAFVFDRSCYKGGNSLVSRCQSVKAKVGFALAIFLTRWSRLVKFFGH